MFFNISILPDCKTLRVFQPISNARNRALSQLFRRVVFRAIYPLNTLHSRLPFFDVECRCLLLLQLKSTVNSPSGNSLKIGRLIESEPIGLSMKSIDNLGDSQGLAKELRREDSLEFAISRGAVSPNRKGVHDNFFCIVINCEK